MAPIHIRFPDENVNLQDRCMKGSGATTSAAALQDGTPGQPQLLHRACTVRTDFNTEEQCYVLDIAQSLDGSLIATSLSTGKIKLYSAPAGMQLTFRGELSGHVGTILGLQFPLASFPGALYSCSSDGTVRGWDTSSGQQVSRFSAPPGKELFSVAVSEQWVVAGGDGTVYFWDRQTMRQRACFSDTHSEAVTQVRFHPEDPNLLFTASADGLIAVFDLSGGPDEDEGFKAALNIGNSVARLGLYGKGLRTMWVMTHTETFLLWEWFAACQEDAEGGSGPLAEDSEARAHLSQAACASPLGAQLLPSVDYLITCQYRPAADQLWLLAGSNAGAVGFFPVHTSGRDTAGAACRFGPPAAILHGGHAEAELIEWSLIHLRSPQLQEVRAVLWPDSADGICISGGEDARIVGWTATPLETAAPALHAGSASSGHSPMRREQKQRARQQHRQSPY